MINLKIGRGIPENPVKFEGGVLEAELNHDHATWTLEQLGRALAKQLNIPDGELQLQTISFSWKKATK